jgi:hypothetical protein
MKLILITVETFKQGNMRINVSHGFNTEASQVKYLFT